MELGLRNKSDKADHGKQCLITHIEALRAYARTRHYVATYSPSLPNAACAGALARKPNLSYRRVKRKATTF